MFKLLQVSISKFPSCKYSKHVSLSRQLYGGRHLCEGSFYCVSPWKGDSRHGPFSRTANVKFYSTDGKAAARFRGEALSQMHSSVEPDKDEEFVFLDLCESVEDDAEHVPELMHAAESIKVTDRPTKMTDTELRHKDLELHRRSLQAVTVEPADRESCIEFHDVGFPLKSVESSKKKKAKKQQNVYGTPDATVPVSQTCCSGCGALMHCSAPEVPGYLPSEKYTQLMEEGTLNAAICQRCFLLIHHQKALNVTMSKEEYRKVVSRIKLEKALVLLIVDLLDIPDSIVSDLPQLVGKNKRIVILGNKVDLLPADTENYLQRIKRQLAQYCTDAGIPTSDHKDIHLISAKTGYGIENLITSLQTSWKYKGDVYLVGTANAGKSTLFNTLLESDYCKSRASDVIHKATISPWPGTTLNLLKFPIINPTAHRLLRRAERLRQAALQTEEDLHPDELKRIQQFRRQGYLVGRVGRTFRVQQPSRKDIEFDADSLSFGVDMKDDHTGNLSHEPAVQMELSYNEIKDAHWFYDTPGIMKERDILSLLTEQEVKTVVPTHAIIPRTFVLKPGMVLFLGALARIDYLEGDHLCWFTIIASSRIPVHITSLEKADSTYQKHAGHTLLAVPMGGEERMKVFPPLVPQDLELQGRGLNTAVTDIKLSAAGWVAVAAAEGERVVLRVHAPEEAGVHLRDPPLLPQIVNMKGNRVRKSPAYKSRKPPALFDASLSTRGERKRR